MLLKNLFIIPSDKPIDGFIEKINVNHINNFIIQTVENYSFLTKKIHLIAKCYTILNSLEARRNENLCEWNALNSKCKEEITIKVGIEDEYRKYCSFITFLIIRGYKTIEENSRPAYLNHFIKIILALLFQKP